MLINYPKNILVYSKHLNRISDIRLEPTREISDPQLDTVGQCVGSDALRLSHHEIQRPKNRLQLYTVQQLELPGDSGIGYTQRIYRCSMLYNGHRFGTRLHRSVYAVFAGQVGTSSRKSDIGWVLITKKYYAYNQDWLDYFLRLFCIERVGLGYGHIDDVERTPGWFEIRLAEYFLRVRYCRYCVVGAVLLHGREHSVAASENQSRGGALHRKQSWGVREISSRIVFHSIYTMSYSTIRITLCRFLETQIPVERRSNLTASLVTFVLPLRSSLELLRHQHSVTNLHEIRSQLRRTKGLPSRHITTAPYRSPTDHLSSRAARCQPCPTWENGRWAYRSVPYQTWRYAATVYPWNWYARSPTRSACGDRLRHC